jgi:hypothetical protein
LKIPETNTSFLQSYNTKIEAKNNLNYSKICNF